MTTKHMTRPNSESRPATVEHENSSLAIRESQWQDKIGSTTYRPLLDVYDLSDRYEIHVDLPGTSADCINATVNGGILTVEAQVAQRYQDGITPLRGEYGIGDFRSLTPTCRTGRPS
ncbi:MAG: Hsp20/alpha crystallin family protein [Phycisphaerales bacterium]